MEAIFSILAVLVVFGVIALIVAGLIYLFTRLRAGEQIRIPMRLIIRVYIHVVIVAGLVLLTLGGLSNLLQAGFGAAFGKEFSYRPVSVGPHPVPVRVVDREVERDGVITVIERDGITREVQVTPEEFKELEAERKLEQEEKRVKGLDRAMKEGLINGVSLTLIGALIWGIHMAGRRMLESTEEQEGPLNRIYLFVIVVIFGIITIASLAQGVPETVRYALLEPLDEFGRSKDTPGEPLAVAIVALPIWITYLMGTIRAARRS